MKTIESEWRSFRRACFPPDLSEQHEKDLKRTFYGGAAGLFGFLMQDLSAGGEVTEGDMKMIRDVALELHLFNEMVKQGFA
jgi:hypothetical protein